MDLSFPSLLGYEVIARDAVASLAQRIGMRQDRIEDLKTALCEACTNAIEHGNRLDPLRRVAVRCTVDAAQLVVEVYDEGRAAVCAPAEPPQISEQIAGRGTLRGMGLMMIHALADEAGFVADHPAGNCLRIVFHRPS